MSASGNYGAMNLRIHRRDRREGIRLEPTLTTGCAGQPAPRRAARSQG
jgi:hypothetical protein